VAHHFIMEIFSSTSPPLNVPLGSEPHVPPSLGGVPSTPLSPVHAEVVPRETIIPLLQIANAMRAYSRLRHRRRRILVALKHGDDNAHRQLSYAAKLVIKKWDQVFLLNVIEPDDGDILTAETAAVTLLREARNKLTGWGRALASNVQLDVALASNAGPSVTATVVEKCQREAIDVLVLSRRKEAHGNAHGNALPGHCHDGWKGVKRCVIIVLSLVTSII
jgi:nucleotide-binding universal stress UspA family protein